MCLCTYGWHGGSGPKPTVTPPKGGPSLWLEHWKNRQEHCQTCRQTSWGKPGPSNVKYWREKVGNYKYVSIFTPKLHLYVHSEFQDLSVWM